MSSRFCRQPKQERVYRQTVFGKYESFMKFFLKLLKKCVKSDKIVFDQQSLINSKGGKQMARPVKKTPEQWKKEILKAAQNLFVSKGYEETSISDIMNMAGGAKGMFYRFFQSKDEVMHALGNQLFFENNPFEAIKERNDLNGLQKIKALLVLNQSDTKRNDLNVQAIPILKDPHILAASSLSLT